MVFVCTLPADKKEGNICFLFINTCLNLRSNYFIFLYYNEIVKQIIHIIYFGLWKSKIPLSFIYTRFFFLTQRSILLSITKLNFWTFSFRFDIETIRYRSFIIEELVLSFTSLAARNLSPNLTRRPLPCLLNQSFFYESDKYRNADLLLLIKAKYGCAKHLNVQKESFTNMRGGGGKQTC